MSKLLTIVSIFITCYTFAYPFLLHLHILFFIIDLFMKETTILQDQENADCVLLSKTLWGKLKTSMVARRALMSWNKLSGS